MSLNLLLVGAAEQGQVVLVDVLGDVEAVGLDQLLVFCQLILKDKLLKIKKKAKYINTSLFSL